MAGKIGHALFQMILQFEDHREELRVEFVQLLFYLRGAQVLWREKLLSVPLRCCR